MREKDMTRPTEFKTSVPITFTFFMKTETTAGIVEGYLAIWEKKLEKNEKRIDQIWNCFVSDIYKISKSFQSKAKTISNVNYSVLIWLGKRQHTIVQWALNLRKSGQKGIS